MACCEGVLDAESRVNFARDMFSSVTARVCGVLRSPHSVFHWREGVEALLDPGVSSAGSLQTIRLYF